MKQTNLAHVLIATFKFIKKKIPTTPPKFLPIPPNIDMTPIHTKNNYNKITLKKYTFESEKIRNLNLKINHIKKAYP